MRPTFKIWFTTLRHLLNKATARLTSHRFNSDYDDKEVRQVHLFSRELDGVGPPVVDDGRQSDHEDEGVESEDPNRVSFLDDPSRKTDAELHRLRAVRVAVVLPVVPETSNQSI